MRFLLPGWPRTLRVKTIFLSAFVMAAALSGCSLRETAGRAGRLAGGALYGVLHPMELLPHKKAVATPPPRAEPVREAGEILSVSEDGTYAIIRLSTGVAVSPGTILLCTGTGGTTRLRVGEVSYPCCVADIEGGRPAAGDPVKR